MSRRGPHRLRPTLAELEGRRLPSGLGSNVLATAVGRVDRPGVVARTVTVVQPGNITPGRSRGTLLGVAARPLPASDLAPAIVRTQSADGTVLPFRRGVPFLPGRTPAGAFTRVSQPGPFTTGVTGIHGTTGDYEATTRLLGDLNGDGVVDLTDLGLFPATYLSRATDANYNRDADANGNGQVGLFDARALVRNLAPPGPIRPLVVHLDLAPGDAFPGRGPQNSGGVTMKRTVTILGRTTPGSIVLEDSGLGDYSFRGRAIATDAEGRFAITVENVDGITQHQFLTIDPWGQQVIRAYPIYWMNFGRVGG